MNETNFLPIVLTDNKALESKKREAQILISIIEKARLLYIEFFGLFDIEFFNAIYAAKKPHMFKKKIIQEYIKIKDIDLRGINLDKAIEINLLNIPDFSQLIGSIGDIRHKIYAFGVTEYFSQNDLKEVYHSETGKFLNLDNPESIVKQKIEEAFKLETVSEDENEYLNQVKDFAEMYIRFMTEHKTINSQENVPGGLFNITEKSKGKFTYNLSQRSLVDYRTKKA